MLANVVQQLTLGFGIAAAAAAAHLAALLHRDAAMGPTLTDFRTANVAAAIMAAVSTLDALALLPDAGSLVSGHLHANGHICSVRLSNVRRVFLTPRFQ